LLHPHLPDSTPIPAYFQYSGGPAGFEKERREIIVPAFFQVVVFKFFLNVFLHERPHKTFNPLYDDHFPKLRLVS
jgi:hypothetical protein